jgi:ABC-2 type transport system permease protein
VVLGVATLFFGVLPRAIGVAWLVVGYGLFAGTFAAMLELPQVVIDLSPFEHPAELPVESFAIGPPLGLTLLAAALVAVGLVGYRRRGIGTA